MQLYLFDEFNNDDYQRENDRFVFLLLNGFRIMLSAVLNYLPGCNLQAKSDWFSEDKNACINILLIRMNHAFYMMIELSGLKGSAFVITWDYMTISTLPLSSYVKLAWLHAFAC